MPSISPRTVSASRSCSPSSASVARSGDRSRGGPSSRDRDENRVPRPRAAVVCSGGRAMRVCHTADQVRAAFAGCRDRRSSTGSSSRRSRSTSMRSATVSRPTSGRSCSTSKRPGCTRATRRVCCRAIPLRRDIRRDQLDRPPPRACTRRGRLAQRAACRRGRPDLRPRGEPAGVAHRSVRLQGHGHQPRRSRLSARRRRASRRSRVAARAAAASGQRQSGRPSVRPVPGRRSGRRAGDAGDRRGDGERSDLPTAFAKAERAAGRPLPHEGAVFMSVRDADKAAAVPVAQRSSASVSSSVPRRGPPGRCAARDSTSPRSARCRLPVKDRVSST